MDDTLTFAEAYELLDSAQTKDDIRSIISRIGVGDGSGISILFSGSYSIEIDGRSRNIGTLQLANGLSRDADGLRVMGNTEMGKFLVIEKGLPGTNQRLINALDRVLEGNQIEINNFLYGRHENGRLIEPGLWDIASARFAEYAKGDVLTLTGNAKIDRIFARTELPILLSRSP